MHTSNHIKRGSSFYVFNILALVFTSLVALLCLLPFLIIISGSFSLTVRFYITVIN